LVGLFGLSAIVPASPAQASPPSPGINNKVNYQGRLLNAAGAVIADGNYNMKFRIYKNGDGLVAGSTDGTTPGDTACTSLPDCQSTAGTSLWSEEWLNQAGNGVTVKNGYFSVNLGSITSLVGIDLNQPVLWLSTNIAGSPNSTSVTCTPFSACTGDGEMLPMRRMGSAVYAVNAGTANTCLTCILQAPTSTAQNTIAPLVNSVVALTVKATTGTAAQTVDIQQTQNAGNITTENTGATSASLLSVSQSSSAYTGTALLVNVANGSGSFASGAFLDLQANGVSKFKVDNLGAVTLAGAQAADITTLAGTAPTALVFQPGNNTSASSAGAGLTLQAGNDTGATASTGGTLTLKGGNGTGSGTKTGGNVVIDAGTGATANGSISIGTANVGTITVGNTTGATAVNVNAGTGNLNLSTNSASASIIAKTNTNSTTAFQVQNATALPVVNVDTTNQTLTVRAGSDTATLGAELYPTNNFATDWTNTGWNVGTTTQATNTSTNTAALTNTTVAITNGATYQVGFTLSGACGSSSDTITVSIGGVTPAQGVLSGSKNCSGTYSYNVTATSATNLAFTPTSTWLGTISAVTIKQITGLINPALVVRNASGNADLEVRASGDNSNLFIGISSGINNTSSGTANTALGSWTLDVNTTGSSNTANGYCALCSNTTGSQNTANGAYALRRNLTGTDNVALGATALQSNTNGAGNTGIGTYALTSNTTGSNNTANGWGAISTNTTGTQNTAIGQQALNLNTTGSYNSALGLGTLQNNTTGTNNTGNGYQALNANITGSFNTGIGNRAGYQDSGNQFATGAALSGSTAIGAYAQVQANNSIVLGSIDTPTKVGIGTTIPLNTFSVSPVAYSTGTAYQTTTAVTGVGTSWQSSGLVKVGMQFIYSTGQTGTITAVNSDTSITLSTSQTVSSTPGTAYRIHNTGFNVTSAGNTFVQNTSTTAFQVQNAAAVPVVSVDTTNQTLTVRAGSDTATLGSELYPTNNFATDWTNTGWNVGTTTQATHNTGNTNALTNTTVAITAGATYQVGFTLGGTCGISTDTITATIGGQTLSGGALTGNKNCSGNYSYIVYINNTNSLAFTPTSTWLGTISAVTIKQITGTINSALTVKNTSGTSVLEVRASSNVNNVFIGLASGTNDTSSGIENTALGNYALWSNTTGVDNVATGAGALQGNTTGSYNVASGAWSLYNNSTGSHNTANGASTLFYNTTGIDNTATGDSALQSNTTGTDNTATGSYSLSYNTTGQYNDALGSTALLHNTSGSWNNAFGGAALQGNTSGGGNTAFGDSALVGNTNGWSNTAFGASGLKSNTTGSSNTAIGSYAGYRDTGTQFYTGAALSNATAIGANAQVQASNSIVLGSVDTLTSVGIGTTVPTNFLSVSPLDYQAGTATRTNSSAILAGTATTWTSAMIGDVIVFADGTTNTVLSWTDATHITMGTTFGGTTDAGTVYYRFHLAGLQVTSTGLTQAANGLVVGSSTTDAALNLLQLDSFNTFADTATCSSSTNQGALYYNTNTSAPSVRVCEDGSWSDVVTTKDTGLIMFGVVPDSGATNPGDLAGIVATGSGPCRVYMGNATNKISWTGCVAYSGGRRVVVAAGSNVATSANTANNWSHLCLNGTSNQASLTAVNASETSTLPTWSATAPILCLADVKNNAGGTAIGAIFDTRTFTTSTKQIVNVVTTAPSLGMMVKIAGAVGQYTPTTAANDQIQGVVVASANTTTANAMNAIIATSGPASVKVLTTGTFNQYVIASSTAGYTTTSATVSGTAYGNAGLALTSISTTCSASNDNCRGSVLLNFLPR